MTTIAADYSGIAADKQYTYNTNIKFKGREKIFEIPEVPANVLFGANKAYFGVAGPALEIPKALDFFFNFENIKKVPKLKDLELLVVTDKRQIWTSTELSSWIEVAGQHYAIGSGMGYALGAMAEGADPLKAVKTAAKFDVYTGLGYTYLKF